MNARAGDIPEIVVDCEAGRRMGCQTFCCRLIVRLTPDERSAMAPEDGLKSCIDKDPETGLCVHLDLETQLCGIWDRRPQVCRGYSCNRDPLLQIALRRPFGSLVDLVRAETDPTEPPRYVPSTETRS